MTSPVRLTSLKLRNFKAVGETTQTITFAPITLLFGPNSAGKSTILHALHYAREILCHRNLDPHNILDDSLDLGGFRALVHDHDLDRTVTLGFAFEVVKGPNGIPFWLSEGDEEDFGAILGRVETCALWIDVRFNKSPGRVYVARYTAMLNGQPVGTIEVAPDGGSAKITTLNHHHPVLFDATAECWSDYKAGEITDVLGQWFGWLSPQPEHGGENGNDIIPRIGPAPDGRILKPLRLDAEADALPRLDAPLFSFHDAFISQWDPYGDLNYPDSYVREDGRPIYGRRRHPEARVIADRTARAYNIRGIAGLCISIGFIWPAELLSRGLKEMLHIGPIREIPPRSFAGRPLLKHTRWIDGLAAWDILAHAEDDFIARVNGWLDGKDRLNSGYTVRLAKYRELPIDGPVTRMLERGELPVDADAIRAEIAALPVLPRVYLRRGGLATDLLPADVGVGLSQLVPIVVAALHAKGALIVIEQPELHNHPAIQVALGDLFIDAAFPKLPDISEVITEKISQTYLNYKPEQAERLQEILSKDAQYLEFITSEEEFITSEENEKRDAERVCFLIETHSELLILRLMRRIRDTNDQRLPEGVPPVRRDDVSILYVQPTKGGAVVRQLALDEDGSLVDNWPGGFFEEGFRERFA